MDLAFASIEEIKFGSHRIYYAKDPLWLCEIKIVKPSNKNNHVRYFPWIYHYDSIQPQYNFHQKSIDGSKNIFTHTDEGQIFYDLIKMLRFCEELKAKIIPDIYQLIAISNTSQMSDPNNYSISMEYAIQSLQRLFDMFNENNTECRMKIYKSDQRKTVKISCKPYSLNGSILLTESAHDFHHILIKWSCELSKRPFIKLSDERT